MLEIAGGIVLVVLGWLVLQVTVIAICGLFTSFADWTRTLSEEPLFRRKKRSAAQSDAPPQN